jgi:polyisoprenoid-binding protein YceI
MRLRTAVLSSALLLALAPLARPAEEYKVDGVHSSVVFRIKHFNVGYVYGRFNDISGTVNWDADDPSKSSLDIEVKTDSVDTNNAKRDGHLRGPDFFSAKEFPTIRFKSTEVKLLKDKTYRVTGDLTLHGVTKPVTIELKHIGATKDPFGGYRTGFETNFSVNRIDFGMKGPKGVPNALGESVWLLVGFEATRK